MAENARIAEIFVLSALLATAGCTTMVLDRYHGAAMKPSLYFRVDDIEPPVVRVTWVRHLGSEEQEGQSFSFTEGHPNLLAIRPELEGCPFVHVFVNGEPLYVVGGWKRATAIEEGEVLIPGQDDWDCSLMLTFRTMGSPPTFSISAATKNGVVEEFPDGKRNPAWLLLVPPTFAWDTVWITTGTAVLLVLADPGALF